MGQTVLHRSRPVLHAHHGRRGSKRVFIPATIYDNKHLIEADPKYLLRLESITDDNLRRAWLNGDWNVVAGAFFGDVWSPNRNVIRPFAVPKGWYCFRSADGTAAPDGVFYPRGALIRFAEWYGAKWRQRRARRPQ